MGVVARDPIQSIAGGQNLIPNLLGGGIVAVSLVLGVGVRVVELEETGAGLD